MERFLVALALVAVALVVAWLARRQGRDAPTQPRRFSVPAQLDRADFDDADRLWLLVVFSSATCDSCAGTVEKAAVLACADVAVQEVEVGERGDLHRRYAIDAVPTIVLADADGVVVRSFVGPPTATDLWAAVADARDPGSSPEPHLGRSGPDD